jgi:hypothetical protein
MRIVISPPVTIVVPAYQAADTIRETLVSLIGQTYAKLEIVVVDDGSSDSTNDVVQEVARSDSRIRLFRQGNAGQAAALNSGWRRSSGVYLGYLGADDVLHQNAVERIVQFLEVHPEYIGAYPDYDLIDASSKVVRRIRAPDYDPNALVEQFICQPGPGALLRRAAFERTGGWNPALRQMPDFDFWLRLTSYGELARFPESLAGFRVHERSQTFAASSVAGSEEPPQLMAAFLANTTGNRWSAARAMGWSHIMAARLHLRAGRMRPMLRHLKRAMQYDAAIGVQPRFWRLLAGGAFGQVRYRFLATTRTAG